MDLTLKELQEKVEKMEKDLQSRVDRLESETQIMNLLGKYENLHSASKQEETEALFAKKSPGLRLIFNGNVYEGPGGVANHYTGLLAASEKDLTGRLYSHDVSTPVIQVAKDNQTAKVHFSSFGFETLPLDDGTRESLFSYAKFRFDFIKEDGEWKIWHIDMHGVFNTPYTGQGWAMEPYRIGFATNTVDNWDTRWAPDYMTKVPYKPLSTETADCDVHNYLPPCPDPYDTWDEPQWFSPLEH